MGQLLFFLFLLPEQPVKMKIALLGYGKMGREIEKIALERNHEIILRIDIDNQDQLSEDSLKQADVAIDFSIPESAYDNIMKCLSARIPVVSGTTGWLDKLAAVEDHCKKQSGAFFYASNFSIGMNIFFEINRKLARIMDRFPGYNVRIDETHHIHKLDAPSGTAITLAEGIIDNMKRKNKWALNRQETDDTIGIHARREGEIPGIHIVDYDSEVDHLQIKHAAKSRKGLALGAVMAAEYIRGKVGMFGMRDLLNINS